MAKSNVIRITVADPPETLVPAASGAASVKVFVESPLAAATQARTRRLTYSDQVARYANDEFLKFVNGLQAQQFTFFTKNTLRNG